MYLQLNCRHARFVGRLEIAFMGVRIGLRNIVHFDKQLLGKLCFGTEVGAYLVVCIPVVTTRMLSIHWHADIRMRHKDNCAINSIK
jgi:uncharacterized membrane protein (DUF485 family)